jgi:hypothetical protein
LPASALRGRLGISLAACLLLVLAFASGAKATGEYEPNDTRDSAYGPLAGGTDYTARFETENDVDWYVFYVRQYSQMDFSATGAPDCIWVLAKVELRDLDGKSIERFESGWTGETNHLYLTLEPGRYYLEIRNPSGECLGEPYRFRIDPVAAITSSRECGEAIVARDGIGPELAATDSKLGKTSEQLATKAKAVKKAKKVLRRLQKRRRTRPSQKRQARRRLDQAKAARTKVWQAKASLESIRAQHQQTLANAEGQIATYC